MTRIFGVFANKPRLTPSLLTHFRLSRSFGHNADSYCSVANQVQFSLARMMLGIIAGTIGIASGLLDSCNCCHTAFLEATNALVVPIPSAGNGQDTRLDPKTTRQARRC